MRDRKGFETAIEALRDVGSRARVWVSMPVIEGITPRALLEAKDGVDSADQVDGRAGVRILGGVFQQVA